MKKVINSKLGLLIVSLLFFPKIVMANNWWGMLSNNTDKTIIFASNVDMSASCLPPHTEYLLNVVTRGLNNIPEPAWMIALPNDEYYDVTANCKVPGPLPKSFGPLDQYADYSNVIARQIPYNITFQLSHNYKFSFILNNDFSDIVNIIPGSDDYYFNIDPSAGITGLAIADK